MCQTREETELNRMVDDHTKAVFGCGAEVLPCQTHLDECLFVDESDDSLETVQTASHEVEGDLDELVV